ncbi:MAG: hypothetical protein JKY93_03420 [Gammaproteobacteria bacterium]|nr:hypothetical protein [Gammaproteobacteria bacterium]
MILVVLVLFGWHTFDKTSAVKRAVVGFIAKTELATAQAAQEELQRKLSISESANANFQTRFAIDNQAAIAASEDLKNETYDPACVVSPDLAGRLLNN